MSEEKIQRNKINWFPGHMAKTKRLLRENISLVDIVIEILDARIPLSSHNPDIEKIAENKPKLLLLNKSSLANPDLCGAWADYYEKHGYTCVFTDCITGKGIQEIPDLIRKILSEKVSRYREKGMEGRALKAMVVGIPNSGKSTFINRMTGLNKAKAENRPGVTKDKQWISTGKGIDLLDTPGVLWPKFEDDTVGENLAITGAIKDDILDAENIACILISRLRKTAVREFTARYRLDESSLCDNFSDYDLLEAVGKKRGFLSGGGAVNTERTASMLIDEFRSGKIGRITLETPPKTV